jgi:hypothetical protein
MLSCPAQYSNNLLPTHRFRGRLSANVFTLEHSSLVGVVQFFLRQLIMAKKARKRRYSKSSGSDVKSEMRRYKKGKAKTGRGGKGGKVKSRKQAIAIGLSKARKKGKKVPRKKS